MSENKVNESVLTGNLLPVSKKSKRKPWPKDCAWPEPLAYGEGQTWDVLSDSDVLNDKLNLLKINYVPFDKDPAVTVREITGYEFINENLLRQAFTRRAFAMEYGLPGCNEELEFLGDTVLNTVVTREILHCLAQVNEYRTAAPFEVRFQEGCCFLQRG